MPYLIIALFVVVVGLGSRMNDKHIERKGGNTEYITEHFRKK